MKNKHKAPKVYTRGVQKGRPQTVHEALSHPSWKQTMVKEMTALHSTGTWDLDPLPASKGFILLRLVWMAEWIILRKARLVVKGYTKIYGSDYYDTFSSIVKMAYVRLLLSMVVMSSWPLY